MKNIFSKRSEIVKDSGLETEENGSSGEGFKIDSIENLDSDDKKEKVDLNDEY